MFEELKKAKKNNPDWFGFFLFASTIAVLNIIQLVVFFLVFAFQ